VVGAAMELGARFGAGKRAEEFGTERQETLLCALGMGRRGYSALCL
jgi:hypothetical protein